MNEYWVETYVKITGFDWLIFGFKTLKNTRKICIRVLISLISRSKHVNDFWVKTHKNKNKKNIYYVVVIIRSNHYIIHFEFKGSSQL